MSDLLKVTAKTDGLLLTLQGLAKSVQPQPILAIAGEVMMSSIDRTFKEEGSPAGSWAPLAPSTREQYRKRGKLEGHKLLVLNRRLRNSIHPDVQGNVLTIGTNLKYAPVHQYGAKSASVRILEAANGLREESSLYASVSAHTRKVRATLLGPRTKRGAGPKGPKTRTVGVGAHKRLIGGGIPARPYLVVRPEDPKRIETAVDTYLQKALNETDGQK